MQRLRVIIADDHALFREGLKSLLRLQSDIDVVGEAERIAGLDEVLAAASCDVLLLDLSMERNSLADISVLAAKTKVVVVTANERTEDAISAVRAGASAVVFKRYAVATLMDAIRAAAGGLTWLPPTVQAVAVGLLRGGQPDALTAREVDVVRHVARGLRNAEIAAELFISEQTVKTHLANIFQKLGVRDRVALALYASRVGIVAEGKTAI